MLRLPHPLIMALSGLILISACGASPAAISDEDRTNIDCLAAKTVMNIAHTVRTSLENGAAPESLSGVEADLTQAGAQRLSELYRDMSSETYFRQQTSQRLTAMQNALSNRAPDSPDQRLMDETMALARSCSFGAA